MPEGSIVLIEAFQEGVYKGSALMFCVNICWAISYLKSFDYGLLNPSTSEICENFGILLWVG
jgi:hypothetical protein